jgi:hypothetical protein
MKDTKQTSCHLGSTIESALALLDPKGTDTQISQAMSIVRMAFSEATLDPQISPRFLYERACQMYPIENPFPNSSNS